MGKTSVKGPDVGHVLVFGQVQSDFEHQSVKLGVQFNAEEGHLRKYLYVPSIKILSLKPMKILEFD